MANPALAHDRVGDTTVTTPTLDTDVIEGIRSWAGGLSDWEVDTTNEDPAAVGSKKYTYLKPKSGRPNPYMRIGFYCSSVAGPAQLAATPNTDGITAHTAAVNVLYMCLMPFVGEPSGPTFGLPSANPQLTGGTARQRAHSGWYRVSGTIGDQLKKVRGYQSPETLLFTFRHNTSDLTLCFAAGAWINPLVAGNGGTDDRIYGLWTAAGTALQANAWDDGSGAGFFFVDNGVTANSGRFVVLDPAGEDTWRHAARAVARPTPGAALPNRISLDEFDNCDFPKVPINWGGSAAKNFRIGHLRNIYMYQAALSDLTLTTSAGAVVVGRTVGRTESTQNDTILVSAGNVSGL